MVFAYKSQNLVKMQIWIRTCRFENFQNLVGFAALSFGRLKYGTAFSVRDHGSKQLCFNSSCVLTRYLFSTTSVTSQSISMSYCNQLPYPTHPSLLITWYLNGPYTVTEIDMDHVLKKYFTIGDVSNKNNRPWKCCYFLF